MKAILITISIAFLIVVGQAFWFSQKQKQQAVIASADKLRLIADMQTRTNTVLKLNNAAFESELTRYRNVIAQLEISKQQIQRIEVVKTVYKDTGTTKVIAVGIKPGEYKWEDKTACLHISGFLQISADTVRNYINRRTWSDTIKVFPYVERVRWYQFGKKKALGYPAITFRGYTIPRVRAAAGCGEVNVLIIEREE